MTLSCFYISNVMKLFHSKTTYIANNGLECLCFDYERRHERGFAY